MAPLASLRSAQGRIGVYVCISSAAALPLMVYTVGLHFICTYILCCQPRLMLLLSSYCVDDNQPVLNLYYTLRASKISW